MEVNKFTAKQCDGDVAEFLKPYIGDGRSMKFGALLVKEIPASRQVLPPDHVGCNPPATLQAASYFALKITNVEGIYILNSLTEDRPLEFWKQMKEGAPENQYDLTLNFMDTLRNGHRFEVQSVYQKDFSPALRKELGLKVWPFRRGSAHGDPALQLAVAKANCEYLKNSDLSILNGGPIKVYTAVAKLHLIYYHHEGRPVRWIVVPPSQKQTFEYRMRHAFNIPGELACSQFLSHLSIWIEPAFLNLWGISYYEVQQKPGQVLFVFAGSYIWGHGTGVGVIERKHYIVPPWKLDNFSFCSMQTDACRISNPDGAPVALSQENIEEIEVASTAATWRPRMKKPILPLNLTQQDFEVETAITRDATHKDKKRRKPLDEEPSLESPSPFPGPPEPPANPSPHANTMPAAEDDDDFYFSDGSRGLTPLAASAGLATPHENYILRGNVQQLAADRDYLYQRKEVYKQRLYALEEHLRAVDAAAQREAQRDGGQGALPESSSAGQARDRRIAELEEELWALRMAGPQ